MNVNQFQQEFGQLFNSMRDKNPIQIMQNLPNIQQQILGKYPNLNPQQMVNEIMQSGKIPQQKFEQARNILGMFGMKL